MLSVNDTRRSRSKSPGGRDRDRSRSRDTRDTRETRDIAQDRSPGRQERRSSKYEPSESEDSEEDRRHREKRSSKKYYDDDSEEDKRTSRKSSKKYYDDDSEDDRKKSSKSSKTHHRDASVSDDDRRKGRGSKKEKKRDDSDSDRRSSKKDKSSKKKSKDDSSSESEEDKHKSSKKSKQDPLANGQIPQYAQPPYGYAPQPGYVAPYGPPAGYPDARHMSYVGGDPRYAPPPGNYMPPPPGPQRAGSYSGPAGYVEPDRYQYAQPPREVAYRHGDDHERDRDRGASRVFDRRRPEEKRYHDDEYDRRDPKRGDDRDKRYYEDKYDRSDRKREDERRDKKYHDDKSRASQEDMTRRLSKLAVGGAAGAGLGAGLLGVAGATSHRHESNGKPPASPLLESYKGTYQSISPMPGALVMHKNDSDISDLDMDSDDSVDSDDPNADLKRKIKKLEKEKANHKKSREKGGKDEKSSKSRHIENEIKPRHIDEDTIIRSKDSEADYMVRAPRDRAGSDVSGVISPRADRKRVMFYDAEGDAKKIAAALEGTTRPPNVKPLIKILPGLSDDDVMALRLEYKNVAKVGGQGINIAKHIKMRVPGNLGKACYATALGRWESEAYWANSWYQGGATRRELLIESLMGRSNSDIREIKNCFKDKRYGDDLEKCMKAELKADKFRTAILLALEERRMPESSPISKSLVKEDVMDLHKALTNAGGETALISIIVVRSDLHLRQVLKLFESTYNVNFARAMIDKSRNLVGETLAHVLNGALNRPMQDALLLHQAISETAPGKERAELLISRLVRLHWEPKHLEKVKAQYNSRYGMPVEAAIVKEVIAHMKTEEGRQWSEFCVELVRSSS